MLRSVSMNGANETCFGYRICPTEQGWSWVAFDPAGEIQERGTAPSRAIAAACVIRALARAAAPAGPLRAAA